MGICSVLKLRLVVYVVMLVSELNGVWLLVNCVRCRLGFLRVCMCCFNCLLSDKE